VIFLSNFSLNNNFSHFLHGLLRLFCALMDARLLVWNSKTLTFTKTTDYVIWLDENVKVSKLNDEWFSLLGRTRHLKTGKSIECFSADKLVYGSGCVRLLPPEKWYGYPGCRAHKVSVRTEVAVTREFMLRVLVLKSLCSVQVLPAFSQFIRSQFDIGSTLAVVKADSKRRGAPLQKTGSGSLNVAFSVRKVGDLTGRREISNLEEVSATSEGLIMC
jgi:hypothetical protein